MRLGEVFNKKYMVSKKNIKSWTWKFWNHPFQLYCIAAGPPRVQRATSLPLRPCRLCGCARPRSTAPYRSSTTGRIRTPQPQALGWELKDEDDEVAASSVATLGCWSLGFPAVLVLVGWLNVRPARSGPVPGFDHVCHGSCRQLHLSHPTGLPPLPCHSQWPPNA